MDPTIYAYQRSSVSYSLKASKKVFDWLTAKGHVGAPPRARRGRAGSTECELAYPASVTGRSSSAGSPPNRLIWRCPRLRMRRCISCSADRSTLLAVARLPFTVQLRPDNKRLQQPMCLDGGGQSLAASPGRVSGGAGGGKAVSQGSGCTSPKRSAGGGAGEKALWGREGAKPLGALSAASAAMTRVRDGCRMAETPLYRRLGA